MSFPSVILLVLVTTSALAAQPESLPPPAPFQPKVEDPMLTPVPPAQRLVGNWDEALTLVRERSTDLRLAEANIQRAEARWRQALAALLPNVRASVGVGHDVLNPDNAVLALGAGGGTTLPSTPGPDGRRPTVPLVAGAVSVSQSLVDFGAWRGLSSAEAAETGAVANLQDVRRRLTLGMARVLVATVAAERVAELNRVGLRQALERAALTQRIFELGASNQLDVVRVNQDVSVARGALVSGDEQLRRAREALGLSLGLDRATGVSPAFNLQGLVEQIRQVCAPLESVSARPDLVAARAQLESARDSRRQASAGYLPTLGLSSSLLGYTTEPAPGRLATWNISAVLSVPLWEGGLRGGVVSERQGIEQQAAETLERTRRDVELEVARSRRSVEVAEALVKTAAESRSLAERTDQLT
ncbi:MAG TPA: TolC family protein, partial [Archangium sp.]|uniref:TolC family protein n=1 Tax=Archangium sp. TaxID=1872627 RepID=UPI002ED7B6CE